MPPPASRLQIFEQFPKHLRVGPWSIVAKIFIPSVILLLALAPVFLFTLEGLPPDDDSSVGGAPPSALLPAFISDRPRVTSALSACYMLCVIGYMLRYIGAWPFASFTMLSWSLTLARHTLRAMDLPGAEVLHFPALMAATITFFVWWIVLVPVIYVFGCKTPAQKRNFVQFNRAPFLVNIHGLSFPLMLGDHLLAPRRFVPTDLWLGVTYGMCYLLFYLNVLDPKGFHFYIIFTPRTPLCFIPYSLMLVLIYGIYTALDTHAGS